MDTKLPPYATFGQRLWFYGFRVICGLIFFFLIAPILTIIPLSFNAEDFFTFTPGMLAFESDAYSLRHYRSFFGEDGHPWWGLLIGLGFGIIITATMVVLNREASPRPLIICSALGAVIGMGLAGVGVQITANLQMLDFNLNPVLSAALALFFNALAGLYLGALIASVATVATSWRKPSFNLFPILIFAILGLIVGKLTGLDGEEWMTPMRNSLRIAPVATLLSVGFGTLAAIGLSQTHVPFKGTIMAILISPMIVPLIISAAGMYFFYSRIGLQGTFMGVVLAHAALGIPFVIITVTATLVGFDRSLTRAAANLGANPVTTFFRIQMPLILPGVISGGLFAFITSFDEVVVVIFVGSAGQQTLPWQMFTGLREQISPTILAAATVLVAISVVLLAVVELLRQRSERLRGIAPH